MTERDLRDTILLAIYNNQGRLTENFDTFCKEEKFPFKDKNQQSRVLRALKDNGYIDAMLFEGGGGVISGITSSGVDYIENLNMKAQNKTDFFEKEKKDELIGGNNNTGPTATTSITLLQAHEDYQSIKDENVPPCFGVEKLAECFVKQLDTTSGATFKNVCMVGIFAPWGRGKSYFFKKVKETITKRNILNSSYIYYDIVEFNAWKYQETPAVWAYLFETIFKHKNRWFRIRYTLKRNWRSIIGRIVLFLMPFAIILLTQQNCDWIKGTLGFGVGGLIVDFLFRNYNSAISFIRRFSKGVSFSNEMGIQAEIEKELTSLLKFWICKKQTDKKKIILYVDDIDRCSETKMVSIIDSLRTVLENEEIRERLIVICSIDHNKLISGVEYKYKGLFDDKKELGKIAIEQLDKIFLTCLSLSRLDIEQQLEFLAKIANIIPTSDEKEQHVSQSSNIPDAVEGETKNPDITFKNETYKMLSKYIRNSKSELTPRKIRVIYYRVLLANNIISRCGKVSIFPDHLVKAIFDLSCGNESSLTSNDAFYNVVEMVVPY